MFFIFFWYRICISFVSNIVIIYWHVLYLLDFDTTNMVSFDTKYILLSKTISLKTTLLMTCFVTNGKNLKYSKVLLYIYLFIYLFIFNFRSLWCFNFEILQLGPVLSYWQNSSTRMVDYRICKFDWVVYSFSFGLIICNFFFYDFVIDKFSPLFLFSNLPNPSLYNDKELLRSLKIENFCAIILVVKKFNFLTWS